MVPELRGAPTIMEMQENSHTPPVGASQKIDVPNEPEKSVSMWKIAFNTDRMCVNPILSHDVCPFWGKADPALTEKNKRVEPPPGIPSPPAPPFPHKSQDGVPELIPIPCKACEQDRKDRLFIRGSAYTNSMTKVLVDFASSQSGGKILAQADNIRGASDILASDDNRYLLSLCSNKVWFTIRLGDEVFIEKLGIVSNELFASNFRHIQVLGSRQYPTAEWRVLGEIETNPEETQEWFDLSASGQCTKCYVKYVKLRMLTHHELEGYTNCALTRIQIFGSTVLQSLDRIQHMNTSVSSETTARSFPSYLKPGSRGAEFVKTRLNFLTGNDEVNDDQQHSRNNDTSNFTNSVPQEDAIADVVDDGNNPLLKFIEEVTRLKKQYESVTSSLYSMKQILKTHSAPSSNSTSCGELNNEGSSPPMIFVSILGYQIQFGFPPQAISGWVVIIFPLVLAHIFTWWIMFFKRSEPRAVIPDLIVSSSPPLGRRFSVHPVQFKKRHHGLWRPQSKRSWIHSVKARRDDIGDESDRFEHAIATISD